MAEKTVTEYQRIDSARQKAQQEKAKRKIYPINKAQPAGEQKPVPKFLKEEAATESRAKKIRALYKDIETLRKNELPSKESPKMVRQLSDKEWLKQMHAASRQLNALLKKDNAMERLSDNAHLAVTLGSAPLINAAKGLYFSKDKKSGGKVKNYGYMGGGKVYGQPRKATYKAG